MIMMNPATPNDRTVIAAQAAIQSRALWIAAFAAMTNARCNDGAKETS